MGGSVDTGIRTVFVLVGTVFLLIAYGLVSAFPIDILEWFILVLPGAFCALFVVLGFTLISMGINGRPEDPKGGK
jgi:hypothetical protein